MTRVAPASAAMGAGATLSEPTWGIVLAGGRARRMGGGDKPLRRIGGRTILDRVTAALATQCAGVLLSANGNPRRFAGFGLTVVSDDLADAGPLGGILAGLDHIAERSPGAAWCVSVAGDTPFIPGDLVARLHAARHAAGARLAHAASGGRAHPVVALWRVDLREDLRAFLVAGERKVRDFQARCRVAEVAWPVEPCDPFFNVNVPEDLAEAEEIARVLDGGAS